MAADDRELSSGQLQLFANGVQLQAVQGADESPGGAEVIGDAFKNIYDAFEKNTQLMLPMNMVSE